MRAIQVLVVDDSAVVRGLLVRTLESDPQIAIAGTAMHGEAALRILRSKPVDVVMLDVEMPVMDGLTALPQILREFPHARVIMVSALTSEGAETTVRALALGAAGCIAKPVASSVHEGIDQLARELLPLVKALAGAGSSPTAALGANRLPSAARASRMRAIPPEVIVVGSSTGGPNALSKLLSDLPANFQVPIFIAQHMPPTFTPMLARHLEKDGRRPCREAVHGEAIGRAQTYIAPGDFHLQLERAGRQVITVLSQDPAEHFCRPSVNPLFRSAVSCYGNRVLGVMLTGMGDDGIEGTRQLVASGGQMIAQDEASSVVWGMPGAVVREGLADAVLPLGRIADAICQATGAYVTQ